MALINAKAAACSFVNDVGEINEVLIFQQGDRNFQGQSPDLVLRLESGSPEEVLPSLDSIKGNTLNYSPQVARLLWSHSVAVSTKAVYVQQTQT